MAKINKNPLKKITLNLPSELLAEAQANTGLGITATIQAGLKELSRKKMRLELQKFQGKVSLDLDLEKIRR